MVRAALVTTAILVGLAGLVTGPAVAQDDAPRRSCFWAADIDERTTNVLYADSAADYWIGSVVLPPGTSLVFEGEFPHARYMSFHSYDQAIQPVDALADSEIVPDEGSSNPARPGADRTVEDRDYTVRTTSAAPPADAADREPNTLYLATQGAPSPHALVTYRIYVADEGTGATGGVDLPTVSLELPDGSRVTDETACEMLSEEPDQQLNEVFSESEGLPTEPHLDATYPGEDPLRWHKFFNAAYAQGQAYGSPTPAGEAIGEMEPEGRGGYLSNLHNAYVFALSDRDFGDVLYLEGRAPTVPHTVDGDPVMGEAQVRYWSVCTYEPITQRYLGCVLDERVRTDEDGRFRVAVSTPDNRPANATEECGIHWLPWGINSPTMVMLRHMMPSPGFDQAIQHVETPAELADVVGAYLPEGGGHTVAEVEAMGCDDGADSDEPGVVADPGGPPDDAGDEDTSPAGTGAPLPSTGGGVATLAVAMLALAAAARRR